MFECVLGEVSQKVIELENGTNKAVTYWVRYEGSSDFVMEEMNAIKLEPKSIYKFKVLLFIYEFFSFL